MSSEPDPFESLLDLEEQYYSEGHALGIADGTRAGRIEGRLFGLEKGFEKFAAMGVLEGRCAVWEARLSSPETSLDPTSTSASASAPADAPFSAVDPASKGGVHVRRLQANGRLEKHIATLSALVESASLSTENNEDSVSDFDDRVKRAEGKVKVIEKIVGESNTSSSTASGSSPPPASGRGESAKESAARDLRVKRTATRTSAVGASMEDFGVARNPRP